MAIARAPHAAKVTLRDKSTGQTFEVWSVDAREYIAIRPEQYEYVTAAAPPAPMTPEAPAPPPPPVDYEEKLDALGYGQLQEMARRAGLQNINLKKPEMIKALLPHLRAGTISLTTPAAVMGIAPAPQP